MVSLQKLNEHLYSNYILANINYYLLLLGQFTQSFLVEHYKWLHLQSKKQVYQITKPHLIL